MSDWAYKVLRIGTGRDGVFVYRGTEWRLLLEIDATFRSVIGPPAAEEIARVMGWDGPQRGAVCEEVLSSPAVENVSQTDWYRSIGPHSAEDLIGTLRGGEAAGAATTASVGGWPRWEAGPMRRLRELRERGESYGEIAKVLSKEFGKEFTDSGCSAKASRMGLPKSDKPGGRPPKKVGGAEEEGIHSGAAFGAGWVATTGTGGAESELLDTSKSETTVTRDSVGYWPRKPVMTDVVDWYRRQGMRVFKEDGNFRIFDDGGGAQVKPPEAFLAEVNELRVRMGLELFEI